MFVFLTPYPDGGNFFGNVDWTNTTNYDGWAYTSTYLNSSGGTSGPNPYNATYNLVHYSAHLLGEPGNITFDFGAGGQQITEWVVYSDFNQNPVPEPATMLLLGAGLIGLAGFRRKKK